MGDDIPDGSEEEVLSVQLQPGKQRQHGLEHKKLFKIEVRLPYPLSYKCVYAACVYVFMALRKIKGHSCTVMHAALTSGSTWLMRLTQLSTNRSTKKREY